jgi:hypothetical protein
MVLSDVVTPGSLQSTYRIKKDVVPGTIYIYGRVDNGKHMTIEQHLHWKFSEYRFHHLYLYTSALWGNLIFSNYLILSAALGPGVYSASNRNKYQKQKFFFLGSRARPASEADNLTPSMRRLSRQYGILNISQPYRPPWPVTGIALLFTVPNRFNNLVIPLHTCRNRHTERKEKRAHSTARHAVGRMERNFPDNVLSHEATSSIFVPRKDGGGGGVEIRAACYILQMIRKGKLRLVDMGIVAAMRHVIS